MTFSEAKGHVVGFGLVSAGGFRAPKAGSLIGWGTVVPRGKSSVILNNKTGCEEVKFPENDSSSSQPPSLYSGDLRSSLKPFLITSIIFLNYNLWGQIN